MSNTISPAVMPHNMTHFLRLADHLTLEELHDRTGVSTNMLSRMEHGQYGSISTTKRVANALRVSMNTLARNDTSHWRRSALSPSSSRTVIAGSTAACRL